MAGKHPGDCISTLSCLVNEESSISSSAALYLTVHLFSNAVLYFSSRQIVTQIIRCMSSPHKVFHLAVALLVKHSCHMETTGTRIVRLPPKTQI